LDHYSNGLFTAELKTMAKARVSLVAPNTKNRTVTPRRRANAELRTRVYLTDAEGAKLMEVAKGNHWGVP
jgi:type 1 fimbriae regulatory protein FimB/type 1 fimbriae regulatory protein FimE